MCSSSPAIYAVTFAFATIAAVAVEPTAVSEARNSFSFPPGSREKVWSAVVLASNAKKGVKPAAVPSELAPFAARLSKFFGYDQFEILGSATKLMDEKPEPWLVPTPNFWLCARATREQGSYRLKMELFHDTRSILKTEAKLGPKSPLFIRGPVHVRGQVIFVFEIKP